MRLIDADKLVFAIQHELWDWKSVDGITATTVLKQTISDIANEPTVEAIPIEWIKDKMDKLEDIGRLEFCEYLDELLVDWEKENARD